MACKRRTKYPPKRLWLKGCMSFCTEDWAGDVWCADAYQTRRQVIRSCRRMPEFCQDEPDGCAKCTRKPVKYVLA